MQRFEGGFSHQSGQIHHSTTQPLFIALVSKMGHLEENEDTEMVRFSKLTHLTSLLTNSLPCGTPDLCDAHN